MKKYKINIVLLVLVSFVVVFFSLKDNFTESIDNILHINILFVLIALILMILNIVFQSLSQYRFLKEVKQDYKFKNCLQLMTIAMFFNAITPFSSGGQPFEMYLLNKEGIKVGDSANALLQNFITYQFALIFIGTIAIILNNVLGIFPDGNLLKNVVLIGFIINVMVMALIIVLMRAKKFNTKVFTKIFNFIFHFKFIKNREEKRQKAEKLLDDFYNSTAIMKNNISNTIQSFFYNFLSLLCLYMIPLFVFFALGEYNKIDIVKSIVLSGYTFLIGSFVPIPGATGGLEYGYMDFFGIFVKGAVLSSSMLVWRLITYYFGMLVGGITLITYRKKE